MSLAETYRKAPHHAVSQLAGDGDRGTLRSHPIDGAVLMGGCDKTTPGLLMGAISMGMPAIYVPAGPMLRGNWRGKTLGSRLRRLEILGRKTRRPHQREGLGRDRGRHFALLRHLHGDGHRRHHDGDHRGARHGVARRVVDPGGRCESSRACAPPPAAAPSTWCGRTLTPQQILTPAAFDNAIPSHMAIGGSTNAIIHLVAMARRAGVRSTSAALRRDFAATCRCSPIFARPAKYLMEDFYLRRRHSRR